MADLSAAAWSGTIRRNLATFTRAADERLCGEGVTVPVGGRTAAVTVCVLDAERDAHVLMIKRAPRGLNSGQWALPGGRVDPGETATDAALRELYEEVGLQLTEDHIVGALDNFVTASSFVITPVVAVVTGSPRLQRNPAEVHSLHRIPLNRLVSDDLPRWAVTPEGPLLQMPLRSNMVVHAPTGAILLQFREVALLGRHITVAGLQQPAFTRV
jgi:8-oxo-dGTP pyrophosphatase MutT (NUDIX family)